MFLYFRKESAKLYTQLHAVQKTYKELLTHQECALGWKTSQAKGCVKKTLCSVFS